MVSDLFDGFLSDESRVSKTTGMPIKPPDLEVIPPLVKWGNAAAGPYTWTAPSTKFFQMAAGVVSLPPNNRKGGLCAWSTLPHETAGHDILHADNGLLDELGNVVYNAIVTQMNNTFLANYWKQCIDEASADILGHLNGGPMIGMGLIVYFRGLMGGALRNVGYLPPADTHPVDILRGFMAATIVAQMPFPDAKGCLMRFYKKTLKDLKMISLYDPQTRQQYQFKPTSSNSISSDWQQRPLQRQN